MDIDLERPEGIATCIAHIRGELDVDSVPGVRERLLDAVHGGVQDVVLDLSGVHYADSSLFSLLVSLDRAVGPVGGRVVVAGANDNVNRVLELSGLVAVAPSISSVRDVREAIASSVLDRGPATERIADHRLTFQASTSALGEARSRIVEILEPLGIQASTLFDIRVAAGEALANAMRHGSPQGELDTIAVEVEVYEDRVVIVVSDAGCGFDGCHVESDDLYATSGRGVMFMRALMDGVEFYTSSAGGTSVRLVKHVDLTRVRG